MKWFNNKDLRIFLLAYALTAVSLAWGHESGPEYLESFDTVLEIRESGRMEIRHVIDVHPHGDEIRRGVFFELPDDIGPLEGFSATLDGKAIEPERDGGDLIVAAADSLELHASHRFVVEYRAPVPLKQSGEDEVELRWRPIIDQFELAWRESTVTVAWPEGRMPARLPANGEHAGGAWRIHYQKSVTDGPDQAEIGTLEVQWPADAWPDGAVRRDVAHWARRAAMVVAILVLFGVLHSMWRAVGRDPETGRVRSSATPPSGISPAASRYIEKMAFDETAFVAALVSLRVKGRIALDPNKDDKTLSVVRLGSGREDASPGERAMEKVLFADSSRVELEPGSSVGAKASSALSKALGREHRGRHFETNNRQRVGSLVLGALLIVVSIGALISELGGVIERDPVVIALGWFGAVAGLVIPLVYFELMKAPTRAGVTARREIEALRRYMSDPSPATSSVDEFAKLLPYAVALEAEEKWRARFGDRLDDLEGSRAADVIAWYRKIQDEFDSTAAIVTIIAASTTTSVSASAGGASAGGV